MKKVAKNPRILVATGLYSPEIGGPATYTKLLEEELPKREISLVIAPFRRVRFLPKIIRHIAYFLYILTKSFRADIIYALDPVSVGLPSLLASNMLGKTFFLRLGGDYAWEMASLRSSITKPPHVYVKNKKNRPLKIRLLTWIQEFVATQSDKIIVPSNYLKDVVIEWGVPKDKISVINNVYEEAYNLANKQVLRSMMQIGLNDPVIISAGRLIPLKGIDVAVRGVKTLLSKYPNLKYIIVGDGPEKNNIENLIEESGLQEHITLTGSIDKQILLRYLKASDIFALNSVHETFPHSILEAMSVGIPVIATNVGGNPEIIDNSIDGLLIEYGSEAELISAVDSILSNQKLNDKLVRNSRTKLEKFEKEKLIKKLLRLIKAYI